MSSKFNVRIGTVAAMLMGVLLTSCAARDDVRQPPTYAVREGTDAFRVSCQETSGRRDIIVRYNAIDGFFNADGTEKTREEFCRESAVGAARR